MHKKGIMILLLAICSALSMFFSAVGEELIYYSAEQVIDYLSAQKPEVFEFTCSEGLYDLLQDQDFRELYRLLVKAGVDHNQASISYNSDARLIRIASVQFTGLPWAECELEENVRQAVNRFAAGGSSGFVLLCTPELLEHLLGNDHLEAYAAQNGIENFSLTYNSGPGILKAENITLFAQPYAAVSDYVQFASAVSGFADRGITDFYIVFDPDLFAKITADPAENRIMTGSSRLSAYSGTRYDGRCFSHYFDVEYTDMPREICRSVDDVFGAVRRMGAVGIRDFELIFPYTDVFDRLFENDFSLLHEIEAQAGVVRCGISYSSGKDRIVFSDAEIVPEAVALQTIPEAVSYTESQVAAGNKDIHLFCTKDLYAALLGDPAAFLSGHDGLTRIYDLIALSGISDYDITISEATHLINISINSLLPGKAIILASRNRDSSSLTAREMETWRVAAETAAQAQDPDPLTRARKIHDWICEHVVYTVDETTDEDDTAVGALLNGAANCDGYSDAFYLIGTLAGLNVRYQHGDSLDKSYPDMLASVTHVWNLLEIDGVWHMVDVTWDDEGDGWTHVWFNAGMDIAERMHVWNRDMTVEIAPVTERTMHSANEFFVRTEEELRQAVESASQQRYSNFYILFEDASLREDAISRVGDKTSGRILHYTWADKIFLLGFHDLEW